MFIETKVWISDYGYDATLHAFDKSAAQARRRAARPAAPASAAAEPRSICTLDAYRALEKLLADGKVRAIGVSNFMPDHLAAPARAKRPSCRR